MVGAGFKPEGLSGPVVRFHLAHVRSIIACWGTGMVSDLKLIVITVRLIIRALHVDSDRIDSCVSICR